MTKPRKGVPALTVKRLLQESESRCSFCNETDVATFEYHHLDEDPSNNEFTNLIVTCSSCHTRITRGIISTADVVTKKRELQWRGQHVSTEKAGVNVNIQGSSFVGDIAQNITKITTKRTPRVAHPPGSIGANMPMKAYVDYLINRYFIYRKADASYGRRTRFSHSVIHTNIQRDFGAKTFFLPEQKFNALVQSLKANIDGTIQGKRNISQGKPNYHSFEDHCKEHGFDPTTESSVP